MAKKQGQARDSSPQPTEAVVGVVALASAVSGPQDGERLYAQFFEDVPQGFAYCRLLYDEDGRPNDWLYLGVNSAFERITGLADVVGRRATDVFPTITAENPELFQVCVKVVESGQPVEFESDFRPLRLWLHVSLVRPEPGHFVALLSDMTSARALVEETRTILRTTIDGYYLVDRNGRFLDTNESYCQMIGYSREELLHMGVRDIEAIDSQEEIRKRIERIMETGHDRFETKHRRRDGMVIDIEASVNALGGDEGKLVVFMRDITERKRVEAVLEESRRDLLEAQRLARIGSWTYDPATQQSAWSEGMFRIWGLAPELGAPPYAEHSRLIHPEDFPRFDAAVREALEHGTPYEMDLRILRPDGDMRTIITTGEALRDADGNVASLRGTTQDITERKGIEEALRESEERFQEFADRFPGYLCMLDEARRHTFVNRRSERDGEVIREAWLGKTSSQVWDCDDARRAEREVQRALDGEVVDLIEPWMPPGVHEYLHSIYFPIPREGKPPLVGALSIDVTEQVEAQDEVRRQAEQLRRTLEGTVLAMSHVVEARDPYTAGHERRVSELSVAIARHMGLDEEGVRRVHVAGLLHDIGKIVVPAEILSKPGRLSDSEFALIKGHPQAAYEILASIDFDFPLAEIIVQHHERLDGSGYPSGLQGEEILPEARILAVADVAEAMVSHRPYRAALPLEEAMAELDDGAGSRYDAAACEAAIRLFREQGFTFSQ